MWSDTPASEEGFRLREYLGVLRVRKWSILIVTGLSVVLALGWALRQQDMYQSVARVQATNPTGMLISQNPNGAAPNMPTEQALVSSETVTKCAWVVFEAQSGDPASLCQTTKGKAEPAVAPAVSQATPEAWFHHGLSVSVPEGTTILAIAFESPKKTTAQAAAEAYAKSYVWSKTFTANARVTQLAAPLLANESSLQSQLSKANADLIAAANSGNNQTFAALSSKVTALYNSLQVVNQQLLEISPAKIDPPVIVVDALLPASPVSPKVPLIGTFGLLAGLAFGIALALVREQLDDRLRGRTDLEERLGVPVLVVVPSVPGWSKRKDVKLIAVSEPKSAVAESYRTLRTSILFTAAQRGVHNIMVVSAAAGEGKTTTAANLAVVLADAGKRVVLLSCDLRKPRIHEFFELGNDVGVSNVLAGELTPRDALRNPGRDNLLVMASGPVPGAPAELLQSEQMGELIDDLREASDFVVIDTAPVLLVADALALAPLVDGVLFVADAQNTSRAAVTQARDQLEQLGARVIGAVLNNVDPNKARAYSKHYGYYSTYHRYGYAGAGYEGAETDGRGPRRTGDVLGPASERQSSA